MYYFSFKAELLQLKLTPIICLMSFINKKSWKLKKLSPPSIQLLKLINKVGLVFSTFNFFINKIY